MKTVIPNIAMSAVLIQTFNAVNMVCVIKFILKYFVFQSVNTKKLFGSLDHFFERMDVFFKCFVA